MSDSKRAELIKAMRAAFGCQVKNASQWLAAAQTNDALAAAFRAVYGSRLPQRQKLGQDLAAWAGTDYSRLRLVSIYSAHSKAFRCASYLHSKRR